MQLLTWTLSGQLCGMHVEECREVVFAEKLTPVPRAPAHVAGILNLRGDVVTVLDLRVLMGYEDKARQNACSVIRLRGENGQFALRADSVSDVFDAKKESLEAPPANMSVSETKFVTGLVQWRGEVVTIIDTPSVLRA
jgi:purine-binding chemotaxis protein CheW